MENRKAQMGELLLISGTVLFMGSMACFLSGHLTQEIVSIIGAMSLIFTGVGSGMKNTGNRLVAMKVRRE